MKNNNTNRRQIVEVIVRASAFGCRDGHGVKGRAEAAEDKEDHLEWKISEMFLSTKWCSIFQFFGSFNFCH